MTLLESFVLGIVEGLTEFLPVSSTGHLIITSHYLKIEESAATNAFEVVIQAGAILAVIWHYRALIGRTLAGLYRGSADSLKLALSLFLGFIPAAVVGLAFHKAIKERLFGILPVAGALILGGLAMILAERARRRSIKFNFRGDETPGAGTAFKIGLFQCLALWPGVSRSMATILGGRLCGLSAGQAAEFSFLLAIPTLLAATGLDLYTHGSEIAANVGWMQLLVGLATSFVVALFVVRFFLEFLRNYSLEIFGWYRIVVGAFILLTLYV